MAEAEGFLAEATHRRWAFDTATLAEEARRHLIAIADIVDGELRGLLTVLSLLGYANSGVIGAFEVRFFVAESSCHLNDFSCAVHRWRETDLYETQPCDFFCKQVASLFCGSVKGTITNLITLLFQQLYRRQRAACFSPPLLASRHFRRTRKLDTFSGTRAAILALSARVGRREGSDHRGRRLESRGSLGLEPQEVRCGVREDSITIVKCFNHVVLLLIREKYVSRATRVEVSDLGKKQK